MNPKYDPLLYPFQSVHSTHKMARWWIEDEETIPTVPIYLTAREQTEGRGSGHKTWWSPKDCGLYLSVVTKTQFPGELDTSWFITERLGHALKWDLRAQTQLIIEQHGINDLYLANRKLGGILCEQSNGYLIASIGLNLFRPKRFPKNCNELKTKAIWMDEFAVNINKEELTQSIIHTILEVCK